MEINNDINEIVYMKRDIKSHRIYEKHPNLMFGIIILVWGLLFFFGCFSDVYWVYWMVLVIIIVPITDSIRIKKSSNCGRKYEKNKTYSRN